MREILVIRFSSLGDLCVLAASLSKLAERPDRSQRRVTLATKKAFAPLMERMNGIDQVVALEDSSFSGLRKLASTLRETRWDDIVDAHNVLRSHLLLTWLGRRPATRLAKDTMARLAHLRWGVESSRLQRSMSDRFDDLLVDLAPPAPDDSVLGPALRTANSVTFPRLGMAPGAQWASKQWPEEHFADLLERFRAQYSDPVRIFLGPREAAWYPGSRLQAAADRLPEVEVIADRSLIEVADLLAECSLVVTNDSGLLHVAEAAGAPVLAFFGPTVRQFGYFPRLRDSSVLEIELECRPCSRNGKRECHRGDLACLERIPPETAFETVRTACNWSADGVKS